MPRGLVQRGAMRSRNGDAAGRGSSAQYGSVATALRVADGWWLPVVCTALPRPLSPSPGSPRRVFLHVSCVVYRGSRTTGSEWDGFSEESVFMAARGETRCNRPDRRPEARGAPAPVRPSQSEPAGSSEAGRPEMPPRDHGRGWHSRLDGCGLVPLPSCGAAAVGERAGCGTGT